MSYAGVIACLAVFAGLGLFLAPPGRFRWLDRHYLPLLRWSWITALIASLAWGFLGCARNSVPERPGEAIRQALDPCPSLVPDPRVEFGCRDSVK